MWPRWTKGAAHAGDTAQSDPSPSTAAGDDTASRQTGRDKPAFPDPTQTPDPATEPSAEAVAASWPHAQYRDWVQSQIASRMLLKLGGFTLATAVLAVGAIYGYYQAVREDFETDLIDRAAAEAAAKVRPVIATEMKAEVALALLNSSAIVEDVVTRAEDDIAEAVTELVGTPDFTDRASDQVFAELRKTGAAQRLILEEAGKQMADPGADPSTRALSLQLFVLFHPSVKALDDTIAPLRQTLAELIDENAADIPPELRDALIRHYPSAHGIVNDLDCVDATSRCLDWDVDMLEFVLREADRLDLAEAHVQSYFRGLSVVLARRVLTWSGEQSRDAEITRPILATLLDRGSVDVRSEVLVGLVQQLDRPDADTAQGALTLLANIDPNAPFHREARIRALEVLWRNMPAEEKSADFMKAEVLRQIALGETNEFADRQQGGTLRQSPPIDFGAGIFDGFANPFGNRADLLFRNDSPFRATFQRAQSSQSLRAIIALLRPAAPHSGGSQTDRPAQTGQPATVRRDDQGGPQEWTLTFRTTIGQDLDPASFAAMALRMRQDRARGDDVSAVAELFLDQVKIAKDLQPDFVGALLSVVLVACSEDIFQREISDYAALWQKLGAPSKATVWSQAVLARQVEAMRPGDRWPRDLVAAGTEPALEYHLLETVAAVIGQPDVNPERPALERAMLALARHPELDTGGVAALSDVVAERFDALIGRAYWDAVEMAERVDDETSFLDGNAPGGLLGTDKLAMDWRGVPLPDDVPRLVVSNTDAVQYRADPAETGTWLRLSLDEELPIRFENLGQARLAVFDIGRRTFLGHPRPNQPVLLLAGDHALHLRQVPDQGSDIRIVVDRVLTPNERTTAKSVGRGEHVFSVPPGDGGRLWLSLDLAPNQTVEVETRAVARAATSQTGNDTDTVIEVFGPEGGVLDSNDDGGSGTYSLLRLTATSEGRHDFQIKHYDAGGDFGPGIRFLVVIRDVPGP